MRTRNVIIIAILAMILLPTLFFSLAQNTGLFSDDVAPKTESFSDDVDPVESFNSDIIDMINQINESLIVEYMETLVGFGPRPTGSENCKRSADYLYNEFKEMGLHVEFDPFSFPRCKDKNVVATLKGSDTSSDAVFIVCCHYDTWPGSPGANDDASGCTGVLAIAKMMSQYSFNHTVKFILFSGHESGAYGSLAYAQKAYFDDENIVAVITLAGFGRVGKNIDAIQVSRSYRTDWIVHLAQEVSREYYEYVDLLVDPVPMRAADHTMFEKYGFTATLFCPGDADPPDHCPEDDLDRIDFSYLTKATKLMLIITAELANMPIDVQVRFVTPREGFFYLSDKLFFKLPGFNHIMFWGFQGMTYIRGRSVVARIDIITDEEINEVIFTIDGNIKANSVRREPPYEWRVAKNKVSLRSFFGKHTLGVTVMTMSGKTAYDEMDVFILHMF
jgi:hypothetical protein